MLQNFLVNQPLWHLDEQNPDRRWDFGVVEDDPSDEEERSQMPRHGISEEMLAAAPNEKHGEGPRWIRMTRANLIRNVLNFQQDQSWHRVALISSAGLGKTANLRWLCAKINAHDDGRGLMLALFAPLRELPANLETLPAFVYEWLQRHLENHDKSRLEEISLRLLKQGRVLFLLDSLDEAGASETGPAVIKLQSLLTERWRQNPVWLSGRPYAFRSVENVLRQSAPERDWTFLRVGLLDEPEARQLVETSSFRPKSSSQPH